MLDRLTALFVRLASLGVSGYPPDVTRRMRIANVAAFAGFLAAFLHMFFYAAFGAWSGIAVNLALCLVWGFGPWWNRFGPTALAHVELASGYLFLLAKGWMFGVSTGYHLYYVPMAIIAAILFGMRDWRSFTLHQGAAAGCLVLSLTLGPAQGQVMVLPPALSLTIYVFAAVLSLIVAALVILFTLSELYRAERTAQEALKAKGRYLAVMSHEIRTPMIAVVGMAEHLKEAIADPEQRRMARIIHDSGAGLVTLINDILDHAKAEAGMMALERVPFDLGLLAGGVVDLMAGHAAAKGLALQLDLPAGVHLLRIGDPTRLRQVALNLVGNAVKFTQTGRVRLAIVGDASASVAISVADTGIGTTEAARRRIFEEYAQADAAIARTYGGTGLGLAITQRLVAAMGGDITVESRPGEGSTFTVRLDLPHAPRPSTGAAEGPAGETAVVAPTGGGAADGVVLVAEDNAFNRMVIARQLSDLGYEAVIVDDGEAAWAALAREPVALVLTDLQMIELDGDALARRIRAAEAADPARARLPILALSAGSLDEDRERAAASGMDGYLTKPVPTSALGAAVQRHAPGVRRCAAASVPTG